MNTALNFISEYFFVYLWLIFTTLVNIIAPIPGSTIVNPVIAFFTNPQRAIGTSAFIFFFTGLHRVYLFRKEILSDRNNLRMVKVMLPYSILGAVGGGLLISYLNIKLLAAIIVVVSLYFISKTIKSIILNTKAEKKNTGLGFIFISILSGFLQGSGMPGSDMRNNYLRTTLSELSVRGVSSFIGLVNFFVSGSIIFLHSRLGHKDILFIATIVPFLLAAQIYGKKFLDKITDKKAKVLAVSLSLVGVVLLTYKYLL